SHPLPEDRQRYGRFTEVQERNYAILRRILETPGGEGGLRKALDYYAACMDETAINSRGLDPIQQELARINALTDRNALPEIVAHLHNIIGETAPGGSSRRAGFHVFFRFGSQPSLHEATTEMAVVGPDGIGLPSREYYIKADATAVKLRSDYRAHIAQILK